jgi:hypothetical protein
MSVLKDPRIILDLHKTRDTLNFVTEDHFNLSMKLSEILNVRNNCRIWNSRSNLWSINKINTPLIKTSFE